MQPKPRHLGAEYGAQFADASVVAAYGSRPPYAAEVFDVLASLLGTGSRRVLELGCGSGDLTLGLAPYVATIDALEPAAAMLDVARARAQGGANVRWLQQRAEDFEPEGHYALVVAAEGLHWMEWATVLPMIGRALEPGGVLAIVTERRLYGLPWTEQARELLAAHSTNREYRRYDVIEELQSRGLFVEIARRECSEQGFTQGVDEYVESFHSRNGFSRERMTPESAATFDAAMRDLVLGHAPSGVVTGTISSPVVWGRPR